MSSDRRSERDEQEPVVIRDNRKIDRDAGGVDAPPAAADDLDLELIELDVAEPDAAEPDANAVLAEERTRDLQRLQAEYANYRKRAERERLLAGDAAVGRVLADLLPVVDDLERAKAHGDLAGPLKSLADKLDGVFGKLGLVAFGEVGDPFDPSIHEAVLHDESDDVSVPTCTTLMRPGYRYNERLLRPAMVGVSDPAHPAASGSAAPESAEHGSAAPESAAPESAEHGAEHGAEPENEVRDGQPDSPR